MRNSSDGISASSSCYFSDNGKYAFSAGGPTARINQLDADGGIGKQVDEMLFVPQDDLKNVNKTRASVVSRYIGLSLDIHTNEMLFSFGVLTALMSTLTTKASFLMCTSCRVLRYPVTNTISGWDAIFMYDIADNGTSELLSVNLTPETHDGPRNNYPSKDGRHLYVVSLTHIL